MAGTKPRIPIAIKAIPKITAIDLTLWNLLLVERTALITVASHVASLKITFALP
jgi:hypothetical protein